MGGGGGIPTWLNVGLGPLDCNECWDGEVYARLEKIPPSSFGKLEALGTVDG